VRDRIILLVFIALITCKSGYSQDHDFGIWYGINTESSITKKLELDVSAMIRTFNNASKIEQSYIEGGLSYKFNKYFLASGSYRLINTIEDDDLFHLRHKFLSDVKGTLPVKDFTFSLRLRLQTQIMTYFEPGDDKSPDFTGRIRLKCQYNIPKFPVNPYFSFESFSPMFENSVRLLGKERISAGFEYKIAKNHSIELGYIFQRDFIPRKSDISIISIIYNIKF
jgi:hypothetical protein